MRHRQEPEKAWPSGRAFSLFLLMAYLAAPTTSDAGAKPGEIDRLAEDLTPIGAERAGNAEGTIPAWEGGLTAPPANYRPGDHHPDPFAEDAPRFRIDGDNYREHEAFLGAGQVAMLRRYSSYFLEVYPTRRSAAFPQHIYDTTAKNGAAGRLDGGGDGVLDVAEGFPFPFAETAHELMWNHRLRYKGTGSIRHIVLVAPTANGDFNEVNMTVQTLGLYYQAGATLESIDNTLLYFLQTTEAPARLAGSVLLVHESLNQAHQPRSAWLYNPGQRRVIRAPNVAYDNPSSATDGLHVSDMTDMFNGALDRFDWQLLGKREMYVPYNAYGVHAGQLTYDELVLPGHLDSRQMRYELHRVWVVEARLKDGMRHINPRRMYYLDEDSYQVLMVDHYDGNDELWRFSEAHPINFYDVPTLWTTIETHHDLKSGRFVSYRLDPRREILPFNMEMQAIEFTPQAVRRMGRR
jgi:hypothetical protein